MKRLKPVLAFVLLVFVGVTVGMIVAQEVGHQPSPPTAVPFVAETSAATPTDAESFEGAGVATTQPASEREPDSPTEPETLAATPEEGLAVDSATADAALGDAPTETALPCTVVAIYFHNTLRCRTCRNIEQSAREAMDVRFPDAFESGLLRWSAVNMEEQPQVVEQYDLVKPTLILVRHLGEEQQDWTALDDTWSLIGRDERFDRYIQESTRAFLEGCP